MGKTRFKVIEKRYQIDVLEDLIFAHEKQVYFLIDLNIKPNKCFVLSGNLEKLGLPKFDEIDAFELLKFIDPNNLLAEVEGRHNFIDKIKHSFKTFEESLFLYIPIKNEQGLIWLYVSFRRMSDKNLVLGQVVRVYNETPPNIIHYQKTYQDSLTRLFSRETLKMHMDYLTDTKHAYLLYLDIDGFKRINDQYGHQAGDQFLVDVANFFIDQWEYNVLYYRLGGDEFAVYCYDHDETSVIERSKKLIDDIANLNDVAKSLDISVSIGIIKISEDNKNYHNLLNLSDKAMYESKERGKGHYTLYRT